MAQPLDFPDETNSKVVCFRMREESRQLETV